MDRENIMAKILDQKDFAQLLVKNNRATDRMDFAQHRSPLQQKLRRKLLIKMGKSLLTDKL